MAEKLTTDLEMSLNIEKRWEIGGLDYTRQKGEVALAKYRTALDALERTVVMRLSELSKLSMSGTGYELRQQISKGLQRHSEAIRNAIKRYNNQAVLLQPPRSKLTWKEIADYTFLAEFDLLRYSRADISDSSWMKPANRAAAVKYFKLCRTREEILRLNVECHRLRTAIHDEEIQVTGAIAHISQTNVLLATKMKCRWR
ncbi:hypothetical protein SERLADRAFT_469506, partial [Serpula lacrymans var. lacrymans S7.9]